MANAPFSGEFESLARQYWNTWNELLGRGTAPGVFGTDPWSLVGGLPPGMGRIDPAGFDWFARIQQLAGQFSEGQASAGEIAQAWRQMLGGDQALPFAALGQAINGGLAGARWLEQMRPLLDMLLRPLREQQADWLRRPTFGPAREHQERLQALALALQEWEQRNEAFNAFLVEAGEAAFQRFEQLLAEHDAPGKRLESARALFDLWIDAAEDAWAEIALSEGYRKAYAEMTNALMRLRLGLQREIEQIGNLLGLPGRSEVDALHRKVTALERALHQARRQAGTSPATRAPARPAAVSTAAARPAAGAGLAGKAGSAGKAGGTAARRAASVKTKSAAAAARPVAARTRPAVAKSAVAKSSVAKSSGAKSSGAKSAASRAAKPAAGTARKGKAATPARPLRPAAARASRAVRQETRPVSGPAKARPARPTGPAKAGSRSRPAARGTAVAAPGVRGGRKPGAAAGAKVVSIKDWVQRNLGAAAEASGKRRGGKP